MIQKICRFYVIIRMCENQENTDFLYHTYVNDFLLINEFFISKFNVSNQISYPYC